MKKINIFCFGFGRVAKSFINKVNLENHNIILHTTSRSENLANFNRHFLKMKNMTPTEYRNTAQTDLAPSVGGGR